MTLLPGWRRYCVQLDLDRCSPSAINMLWDMDTEGRWPGAFAVRPWVRVDEPPGSDWWMRFGGGVSDIAPDEGDLRLALEVFLREHRECFRRVWIGPATEWPPAEIEVPLLLFDG